MTVTWPDETHKYLTTGTHPVIQTVTGEGGSDTDSKSVTVNPQTFNVPTLRATTSTSTNSGTSITVNLPTGTVTNDLMVLYIAQRTGAPVLTVPTVWTQQGSAVDATRGLSLFVYTRIAGAAPGNVTVTSDTNAAMIGYLQSYIAGSFSTSYILNTIVNDWYGASALTTTIPALTTISDNTVWTTFAAQIWGTTSPTFNPTGTWTSDGQRNTSGTGNNISALLEHKTQATAGLTGTPNITSDISNVWAGLTFAINPPGGLPPNPVTQTSSFRVRNGSYQLNGVDFVPVGFVLMAVSVPIGAGDGTLPGDEGWGTWQTDKDAMMAAMKNDWKINTFRLQLGQNGIDPQGRNYSQGYVDRILSVVGELRDNGFVVILCMQDGQPVDGDLHDLPTNHTKRAWQKLLPYISAWSNAKRSGVAAEIFNEPECITGPDTVTPTANDWSQWRDGGHPTGTITQATNQGDLAIGHQQILEAIRGTGFQEVVMAEGQATGHTLNGMPLLTDTLATPNVGYAIHTQRFHVANNTTTQDKNQIWDPMWGDPIAALGIAVTSTEWSLRRTVDETGVKAVTPDLLDYLKNKGIGIQPWAIDTSTAGPFAYVLSKTGPNAWVPNDWDAWDAVTPVANTGAGELLYARYPTWSIKDTNPPPGDGTYSFTSMIDGGGYVNVIDQSKWTDGSGKHYFLIGADVGGVHWSNDGKLWHRSEMGGRDHVAAVKWHPTNVGKGYVHSNEGFYVTTDYGKTFTKKTSPGDADGNGDNFRPYGEHPRPPGLKIQISGSNIWCATATQGVKRSSNDGGTWTAASMSGDHLRSIALDPNDNNTLWLAINNHTSAADGVWKTTSATGAMTFVQEAAAPTTPEELFALDDNGTTRLYCATVTQGIRRWTAAGGWTNISNGIDTARKWSTVDAYVASGGNIVIHVGAVEVLDFTSREIARSTDGGATWQYITTPTTSSLDWTMAGTSIEWVFKQVSYETFANNNHCSTGITTDPDNRNRIWTAGRGGVFLGVRDSSGITNWQPAARGQGTTVMNLTISNPNIPAQIFMGNMDYSFFYSTDHGVTLNRKAASVGSTGHHLMFNKGETTGVPTIIMGTGLRQGASGGVFISSNITTQGWTEITPNNDHSSAWSFVGIHQQNNGTPVYFARKLGGIRVRRVGTGAWVDATGGFAGGNDYGWMETKAGTETIFYHASNGVHRSNDVGATWTQIHGAANGAYQNKETLCWDVNDPDYIYISTTGSSFGGGNLIRISNARTSTSITNSNAVTLLTGGVRQIGMDGSGNLIISRNRKLWKSTNPRSTTPTFTDVSDKAGAFDVQSGTARSMCVAKDGWVYVADNGLGVIGGGPT